MERPSSPSHQATWWPLDKPERDLEWYRPDPRRRLFRPWAYGVLLVCLGAFLCALFFAQVLPEPGAAILLFSGLGSILGGLLTFVLSALKILQDETCVALRVEGVLYREISGQIHQFPWAEIDDVTAAEDSALHLLISVEGRVRPERLRVAGLRLNAQALAARILEVRRQILLGLDPKKIPPLTPAVKQSR